MKSVLIVIFGLMWVTGVPQSLEINNLTVDEEGIVTFSALINASHSNRERYNMLIYSSIDAFSQPIDFTYKDMVPGQTYEISFDGNEQFGQYKGDVLFKFDVMASTFPVKVNVPENQVFKLGKKMNFSWQDYHNVNSYDIELYRRGNMVQTLAEDHTGQSFNGILPKQLDKGNDYWILVRPTTNTDISSELIPVQIKSGVGLAVKIAPLAALGIAVPVYILGGSSTKPGDEIFDAPPGPPGEN